MKKFLLFVFLVGAATLAGCTLLYPHWGQTPQPTTSASSSDGTTVAPSDTPSQSASPTTPVKKKAAAVELMDSQVDSGAMTISVVAHVTNVAEDGGKVAAGDQQLRFGVADDVGGLGRGQARGDRHQHGPGALRSPDQGEIFDAVFQQHREGLARADAVGAQEVGEAVRFGVHLAEAHLLARSGHDHGGMIRAGRGVRDRVHRHLFSLSHAAPSSRGRAAWRGNYARRAASLWSFHVDCRPRW